MPRAIVTGGAGFLGSHLCERLLSEGWEVTGLDSLLTGHASNLDRILTQPAFASTYDVPITSTSRPL
jgi:nucleoside-diphosphate-sugar epimerase